MTADENLPVTEADFAELGDLLAVSARMVAVRATLIDHECRELRREIDAWRWTA